MRENGFTIVETLIVLAVGALLLVGIGNAISGFAPIFQRVKKSDTQQVTTRKLEQLENMLSASHFVGSDGKSFKQEVNGLTFLARLPMSSGYKGLYEQRIEFKKQNNELGLRVIDPSLSLPDVVIAQNIEKISFPNQKQFAKTGSEQASVYKISLLSKDGIQFEIIINPIVDNSNNCVFDFISRSCRS